MVNYDTMILKQEESESYIYVLCVSTQRGNCVSGRKMNDGWNG